MVRRRCAQALRLTHMLDSRCAGWVTTRPDFELSYTAGDLALTISVESEADTTLIINGADGQWYCNDDTNGVNPQVRFDTPRSGTYDIWIGTFAEDAHQPARLNISESTRLPGK
jgi:hypothetical protein